AARQAGDPAEPLEEIENSPLGRQDGGHPPADASQPAARLQPRAVLQQGLELDRFTLDPERLIDQRHDRQAGEDALGASDEERLPLKVLWEDSGAGEVAGAAEILLPR